MQHGRHDVGEVGGLLGHGAASYRPALHHQHRRKFSPVQPAMHSTAFRHVGRVEGGMTGQAPFVGLLMPGEGCDQVGAACVAAAEQRERQRAPFRQDGGVARQQRPGPVLRGEEIGDR